MLYARCTAANYQPHPFQIFQSESAFFIAYSFAGAVRNIFLEDPGPAPVDSWMGQSFGYWEGYLGSGGNGPRRKNLVR